MRLFFVVFPGVSHDVSAGCQHSTPISLDLDLRWYCVSRVPEQLLVVSLRPEARLRTMTQTLVQCLQCLCVLRQSIGKYTSIAMATAPAALHLTAGFERPAQCPRALQSRRTSHARASTRAGSSKSDDVYLLDYGAGNVRSVRNAVKRLGYNLKEVEAKFCDQRMISCICSPAANLCSYPSSGAAC